MSNTDSSFDLPKGSIAKFKQQIKDAKKLVHAMNISIAPFTHDSLEGDRWGISSQSVNQLAKVSIALDQLEMLFQTADQHWSED
jgi:hypothetical protein